MEFRYTKCREEKWSRIYHPKMSLSNADYFKLKTMEAQKIQEETLIFCLRLKECRYRTYSLNRSITRGNCKEWGLGWWRQGLELRVYCVPFSLLGPQTFIYQAFAFPTPCQWPSFPFKSQTTTLNILLCLYLKMLFKVKVSVILASYCIFLSLSHKNAIKLFFDFLLLIFLALI